MEGEEVKWGVMTVISFIPLFNWLVRCLVAALLQLHSSAYHSSAAGWGQLACWSPVCHGLLCCCRVATAGGQCANHPPCSLASRPPIRSSCCCAAGVGVCGPGRPAARAPVLPAGSRVRRAQPAQRLHAGLLLHRVPAAGHRARAGARSLDTPFSATLPAGRCACRPRPQKGSCAHQQSRPGLAQAMVLPCPHATSWACHPRILLSCLLSLACTLAPASALLSYPVL